MLYCKACPSPCIRQDSNQLWLVRPYQLNRHFSPLLQWLCSSFATISAISSPIAKSYMDPWTLIGYFFLCLSLHDLFTHMVISEILELQWDPWPSSKLQVVMFWAIYMTCIVICHISNFAWIDFIFQLNLKWLHYTFFYNFVCVLQFDFMSS